jgi:hypothetical protein
MLLEPYTKNEEKEKKKKKKKIKLMFWSSAAFLLMCVMVMMMQVIKGSKQKCLDNEVNHGNKCIQRVSYLEGCNLALINHCNKSLECNNGLCNCKNDYYWDKIICKEKKFYNSICYSHNECYTSHCNSTSKSCSCNSTE